MRSSKIDKLYDKLHEQLAKEYLIIPEAIYLIRSWVGKNRSVNDFFTECELRDKNASESITQTMKHMSNRRDAVRWLKESSSETIMEMINKDLSDLNQNEGRVEEHQRNTPRHIIPSEVPTPRG